MIQIPSHLLPTKAEALQQHRSHSEVLPYTCTLCMSVDGTCLSAKGTTSKSSSVPHAFRAFSSMVDVTVMLQQPAAGSCSMKESVSALYPHMTT